MLARLPFVLLLTLGLLISLIHCAICDMAFAGNGTAIMVSADHGNTSDVPEQTLPCHSGHCLSHVTAQVAASVSFRDFAPRVPLFFAQQPPAALAGLPLFKPPRV